MESLRLQRRVVAQGNRLMDEFEEASNDLRILRRDGALQVYQGSLKAAKDIVDTQVRIDEAALRVRSSENVVAEILRRLAEHDAKTRG